MKNILAILLLLSGSAFSQSYVYVGIGGINSTTNLDTYLNETKAIVSTPLDSAWNQTDFTIKPKPSFLLSLGYKKGLKHNFSLNIGAEVGAYKFALNRAGSTTGAGSLSYLGLPVSAQKQFPITSRFSASAALGVGLSVLCINKSSPVHLTGSLGGYTTEIYQTPNGTDTVNIFYGNLYNIAAEALASVYIRPCIGLTYSFKNKSYLEFAIGYTYYLQKNLYFESTVSYSYSSNQTNYGGYKYVWSHNFSLPYLFAELKYCIPLLPGSNKTKVAP